MPTRILMPSSIRISFATNLTMFQRELLAMQFKHYEEERTQLPVPPVSSFIDTLQDSTDDVGMHYHIALKENRGVGFAVLEYRKNPINDLSLAWLTLYVQPEIQRQGVSKKLLRSVLEQLPSQIEKVQFSIPHDSELIDHLSLNYKIESKYQTRLNVSDLELLDMDSKIKELSTHLQYLQTTHPEYQFQVITNDDYPTSNNQFADLMKVIWNGIPGKDDERDEEDFPVERVAGRYQWFRDQGADLHAVFLKKDGRYIGFTEVMIKTQNPTVAYQSLTGVDPDYRGMNLGYLIKLHMLIKLHQETEVRYWVTSNAEENPAITHLNEKLGYRLHKLFNIYVITPKNLQTYLN